MIIASHRAAGAQCGEPVHAELESSGFDSSTTKQHPQTKQKEHTAKEGRRRLGGRTEEKQEPARLGLIRSQTLGFLKICTTGWEAKSSEVLEPT